MFKCQKCEKSPVNTAEKPSRPTRVVVERKMVNHRMADGVIGPRGGRGSQIVREMLVCEECLPTTPEAYIERVTPIFAPKQKKTKFEQDSDQHEHA